MRVRESHLCVDSEGKHPKYHGHVGLRGGCGCEADKELKVTCSLNFFDWSVRVEPWSPFVLRLYVFLGIYGQSQSLRTIFLSDELDAAFATSNCLSNQENSKDKKVWIWLMALFFFFYVCILLFALTVQSVRGLLQAGVTDSNQWNNYSHNTVCEQCPRVSLSGVRSEHSSLDKCHWKTPLSVSPQTAGGKSFLNRLQPALIQSHTRFGADLTCMLNTGRLMVWYYRENYYSNENESFNWPEHLNNPAHGAAALNAKFKVSEWFLCFSWDSLWQDSQEEQSPPSAHAPPHISHLVSTEICGDLCNSFHCCSFFVCFKELTAMNKHQTQSPAEKWSRCFFLYRWQWAER